MINKWDAYRNSGGEGLVEKETKFYSQEGSGKLRRGLETFNGQIRPLPKTCEEVVIGILEEKFMNMVDTGNRDEILEFANSISEQLLDTAQRIYNQEKTK